ncbi:MAG: ABC transporter ATP-binding protein [Oscillospiraceae bacterium]
MKIIDLKKKLGDFLLDIDFLEMETGKIHGIIGANGSGKTTVAKLMMGTLQPDSGRIDYEGLSERDVTLTSQKPYLLHTSVYQNLIYPLKIRNAPIDEAQVDYWLERGGLQDKKNQYARSLSSGEQQKLSFIRALIFKPKLIIIDETLSNLDPDSADLFEQVILEQQAKDPITWVTISHQLVHIKKICDVVHFMDKGQVVTSGTPEQMLINPSHPAIIKYLSNTEVSFKK